MILVDSSVWIDHLRLSDRFLVAALEAAQVSTHPFVIGELACGNIQNRSEVLARLQRLPRVPVATDPEVFRFIELRGIMGRGIGYIDAHLLSSAALGRDVRIWTRDRRLAAIAAEFHLAYPDPRTG